MTPHREKGFVVVMMESMMEHIRSHTEEKHMNGQKCQMILFFILCMGVMSLPAMANTQTNIIYTSDFSQNPGWTTNSPTRYFWDPAREMFHFKTEGGTNGYAFIPIQYDDQSFTLDYDVILLESQPNSAFRFGLTSSEMDYTRGTNVLSALENGKYGRLFSLRVIDQNNQMRETTSYYTSYCGEIPGCTTVQFKVNTTYHVTVRYNRELQNADIKVVEKETGERVWGYYLPVGKDLLYMDRLAITTKGDYSFGPFSEGYIDNVEMVAFVPPTPTKPAPTPSATMPPATLPTTAVVTATPQTPTPTQSGPVLPSLPLAALALGAIGLVLANRRGR